MKIKTSSLSKALSSLSQVIGGKSIAPITNCVRLESSFDTLTIWATNLDSFQSEKIPCDDETDAVCVNHRHLTGCIGFSEETSLVVKDKQLIVTCGKKRTVLSTFDAADFPELPDMKSLKPIGVSCEDLAAGMKSVSGFEVVKDIGRQVLMGTHVVGSPKTLVCEAADGGNAAISTQLLITATFEMLIPFNLSPALVVALGQPDAEMSLSERAVYASHKTGGYWCKQIDGKFPSTTAISGRDFVEIGVIETEALVKELSSCLIFSNPARTPRLDIEFSESGISTVFLGSDSELKNDIAGKFTPYKASVNCASLLKCLKAIGSKCKVFADSDCMMFDGGDLKIYSANLRSA